MFNLFQISTMKMISVHLKFVKKMKSKKKNPNKVGVRTNEVFLTETKDEMD